MTISTTASRKVYSGNDSTTAFPTTFPFYDDDDLVVTLVDSDGVETVQTKTTHYTVSGGAGSTGTVTMVTAPATGESLVIEREMDYVQELEYPEGGNFPSDSTETALDKLTMLIQQLLDDTDRSIKLPITTALSDISIPEPEAGEFIRWNSGGTNLETVDLASVSGSLDATIASITSGDILRWNGSTWVNIPSSPFVKNDEGATLEAGYVSDSYNGGTVASGTVTPAPATDEENFQHYINGGAHTLAPPASPCSVVIEITNNGSAGVITTSGFTQVVGDAFDTTDTNKFMCFITKTNGASLLNIVALQ